VSVPGGIVTALACLYLPVAPVMLWIHAVHRAFPRAGRPIYVVHALVYLGLVAGAAALHGVWTARAFPWPAAARVLGGIVVAGGFALLAATYREIDSWTAMAGPQVTGAGGRLLITGGIYARIRHPRYTVLLVGASGNFLLAGTPGTLAALAATAMLVPLLVAVEERELLRHFGAAYADYRAAVPALFPRRGGRRTRASGATT
jgi:protein-S-isoprenylcysteine O-methyltransferase Ste14